jgi:hypothetical protein
LGDAALEIDRLGETGNSHDRIYAIMEKFRPRQITKTIREQSRDDKYASVFIAVLAILVVIVGLTLIYALVKFAKT